MTGGLYCPLVSGTLSGLHVPVRSYTDSYTDNPRHVLVRSYTDSCTDNPRHVLVRSYTDNPRHSLVRSQELYRQLKRQSQTLGTRNKYIITVIEIVGVELTKYYYLH